MPVNMNRKSLLSIQQNPYFITEKSDGTRYLLYVIKDERGEVRDFYSYVCAHVHVCVCHL
jgi:hypothetical protein